MPPAPRLRPGFAFVFFAALTLLAMAPTPAGALSRGVVESLVQSLLGGKPLPSAGPTTDGHVLAYDSTTNRLVWEAGGGGAGDIEGVTAGAGLTGGGTSGTVSVAVGAGTGIAVNADDVAIDVASSIAWTGSAATTGAGTRVLEGWKRRVYTYTGGIGNPTVLTHSQSGSIVCNTGGTEEVYVNLPTLDGAEDVGLTYTFDCTAASAGSYGLRFVAASGDTITVGTDTSASAGYVRTTIVGSVVTIYANSTSNWRAVSGSLGPWEVN